MSTAPHPAAPATIDLNAGNSRLTLSVVPAESNGDRWARLFKDYVFTTLYAVAGMSVLGTCLYLVATNDNPDTQKHAWAFIGLFLGALGGYHMRPRA